MIILVIKYLEAMESYHKINAYDQYIDRRYY